MPFSSYIHIPFCKSRCRYCTFVSCTNYDLISEYIDSLILEIRKEYRGEKQKTLYFGGGTPSLLGIDDIKKVIRHFCYDDNSEITLELNPDDITYDYILRLKDLGINRLSIGAQTFDDKILELIGRRHDSKQIVRAVKTAEKAGFKNISLDLMYGLPCQTLKILESDLEKITDLCVQHISTYGLKIEEGSYFWMKDIRNLPDDDMQADMYEKINEYLSNIGYYRYEISNFAKLGFESRHNLNYWNNESYYGFGAAAHGYTDGIRYANNSNILKYIDNPTARQEQKKLSVQEQLEEEIFLGLRKTEGINIVKIKEKYNIDFEYKYKDILLKYKEYFDKIGNGYRLNLKGILLSNLILSEFIENV